MRFVLLFITLVIGSTAHASIVRLTGTLYATDFVSIFETTDYPPFDEFYLSFDLAFNGGNPWIVDEAKRNYINLEVLSASSSFDGIIPPDQSYQARFSKPDGYEGLGSVFISLESLLPFYGNEEERESTFWSTSAGTNDFFLSFSMLDSNTVDESSLTVVRSDLQSMWEVYDLDSIYRNKAGTIEMSVVAQMQSIPAPGAWLLLPLPLLWLMRRARI